MKNVKEIISQALQLPPDNELSLEDGPETVHEWDSLAHVNIIDLLEEELNVSFSEEEIMSIRTIEDINKLVTEKTNHHGTNPD